MGDISHIDEERERREKEKWQMDPEIQRAEQEFIDWGDRLREQFGKWDFCDPAATAILELVEAQNEPRRRNQRVRNRYLRGSSANR